jgi:hypothetical protein
MSVQLIQTEIEESEQWSIKYLDLQVQQLSPVSAVEPMAANLNIREQDPARISR